jgi:ectoine hydroxylase-related dioxygenase (phytanoyl-CoA dioxygenase family)
VSALRIPSFAAENNPAEIADALAEAGCVVVTGLLDLPSRTALREEIAPFLNKARVQEDDPRDFYPGLTRRTSALAARSKAAGRMILHPISLTLCDRFLLPNSPFGYQLHVSAALEVGPGARAQVLHREEDPFSFFPLPRPDLVLASMWAITDFRPDNGGTLLVPGSHRWPAERKPSPAEILPAQMPAGSVLFWMGGLLHGAGANTSNDWRYGVIFTYSCGWLRQEENQFLDVPPEVARNLPEKLRDLLGYRMYQALGYAVVRDSMVRM